LTVCIVALVIGIPAGIAIGRAAWSIAASQLHVVDRLAVPATLAAAGAFGFLVLITAIAALPSLYARRLPPAEVLRTE
jgi:ABC-type antimicrobial peptide transport system permease subunit